MAGLKVCKGDKVEVISGKEKGKQGKVLRTIPEKDQVVVEGLNMIKRHTRATRTDAQGGIKTKEGSMHASNVKVICSSCDLPVRVGVRRDADGERIRTCRKCGADIDKV